MKHYVLVLLITAFTLPVSVYADKNTAGIDDTSVSLAHPVISEIQTGSQEGASEEFIEIYNPTDMRLQTSGWRVQYRSSSGNSWRTKSVLEHNMEPRGYLLLSTYLDAADQTHTSGLRADGGHVRLAAPAEDDFVQSIARDVSMDGEMVITYAGEWFEFDRIGWGDALHSEAASAPVHSAGESLSRVFDKHGHILDMDNNERDFEVFSSPTPQSTPAPCMDVECQKKEDSSESSDENHDQEKETNETDKNPDSGNTDESDEQKEADSDEDGRDRKFRTVVITEVMPDPVSPRTDARDEFVELRNPHGSPVDLEGYRIQTGSSLEYEYEIESAILKPDERKVFRSRDGTMTLTNNGGRVQVIDPNKEVASQLVVYPEAPAGKAWADIAGEFIWTDNVTPGGMNKSPTATTSEDSQTVSEGNDSPDNKRSLRTSYPQIHITELFPDPDNPLTDADDEFVELHNPNSSPVNLDGYILETGTDFGSSHELSGVIEAGAYQAIFADGANISLVNSGGGARLTGEDGSSIFNTDTYPEAETGAVWAVFESGWQWSEQPTPSASNQLVSITSGTNDSFGDVAGAEFEKSARDDAVENITKPATIKTSPYTTATVVISIVLAILYALYEFRYDIRNRIELTRRYIARWRTSRE